MLKMENEFSTRATEMWWWTMTLHNLCAWCILLLSLSWVHTAARCIIWRKKLFPLLSLNQSSWNNQNSRLNIQQSFDTSSAVGEERDLDWNAKQSPQIFMVSSQFLTLTFTHTHTIYVLDIGLIFTQECKQFSQINFIIYWCRLIIRSVNFRGGWNFWGLIQQHQDVWCVCDLVERRRRNNGKFSPFYRWSIMCRLLPLWRLSIYFRSRVEQQQKRRKWMCVWVVGRERVKCSSG